MIKFRDGHLVAINDPKGSYLGGVSSTRVGHVRMDADGRLRVQLESESPYLDGHPLRQYMVAIGVSRDIASLSPSTRVLLPTGIPTSPLHISPVRLETARIPPGVTKAYVALLGWETALRYAQLRLGRLERGMLIQRIESNAAEGVFAEIQQHGPDLIWRAKTDGAWSPCDVSFIHHRVLGYAATAYRLRRNHSLYRREGRIVVGISYTLDGDSITLHQEHDDCDVVMELKHLRFETDTNVSQEPYIPGWYVPNRI